EGNAKIQEFFAQKAEVVARYQGGNNAEHTIVFDDITYKLHLIPSGIFFKEKTSVLGNGMVIDPKAFMEELHYLYDKNINTDSLRVSNRAHVILPYHIKLDILQEEDNGIHKIGTTKKGIGPAYMDKAARCGIRIADLLDKDVFRAKLEQNLQEKNRLFEKVYETDPIAVDDILEEYF